MRTVMNQKNVLNNRSWLKTKLARLTIKTKLIPLKVRLFKIKTREKRNQEKIRKKMIMIKSTRSNLDRRL